MNVLPNIHEKSFSNRRVSVPVDFVSENRRNRLTHATAFVISFAIVNLKSAPNLISLSLPRLNVFVCHANLYQSFGIKTALTVTMNESPTALLPVRQFSWFQPQHAGHSRVNLLVTIHPIHFNQTHSHWSKCGAAWAKLNQTVLFYSLSLSRLLSELTASHDHTFRSYWNARVFSCSMCAFCTCFAVLFSFRFVIQFHLSVCCFCCSFHFFLRSFQRCCCWYCCCFVLFFFRYNPLISFALNTLFLSFLRLLTALLGTNVSVLLSVTLKT